MTEPDFSISSEAKNEPPTPFGIVVIDKAKGFTSMDVCAVVRGRLKRGGAPKRIKVGHGGTLDPMATGVLVVMVGKATKLCELVMVGEKEYEATVDLSRSSDTDDAEGNVRTVEVGSIPDEAAVRSAVAKFVGAIDQVPPAFSALHVGGRRAYDLARDGQVVELASRRVIVHEIRVIRYEWPEVVIAVRCGKGVYIRSIARDLGAELGTGGMLTALRRTRVGTWTIEQARTLDSLPQQAMTQADLALPNVNEQIS